MKKSFTLILCLTLAFMSCKQDTDTIKDTHAEKEAIKLMLQKYIIANETGNISIIQEIWANDSSVLSLGTDRTEVIHGFEAVKQKFVNQFNTFQNTFISSRDQVIYVNQNCQSAWFSEVLQYNFTLGEQAMEYPDLRFTGYLEKRAGNWMFVHTHLSAPLH